MKKNNKIYKRIGIAFLYFIVIILMISIPFKTLKNRNKRKELYYE